MKDNCDACENYPYFKKFTPEEVQGHKEELANVEMEISDITEEKKSVMKAFGDRLKPLEDVKKEMISNIRLKGTSVSEICYKFVNQDERITLYYNEEGECVGCRPCTADEMQVTINNALRKTGTSN